MVKSPHNAEGMAMPQFLCRVLTYIRNLLYVKFLKLQRVIRESPNLIPGGSYTGINLSGCNLKGIDLEGTDLKGADLRGADLSNADLSQAHLSFANLSNANLQKALLTNARLIGANLSHANLEGINLRETQIVAANLGHANMTQATIFRTNLRGANLQRCNLNKARLHKSNLRGVNLENAELRDTKLEDINLLRASLKGANLNRAFLDRICLGYANLHKAHLSKATLREIDLTGVNLGAVGSRITDFKNELSYSSTSGFSNSSVRNSSRENLHKVAIARSNIDHCFSDLDEAFQILLNELNELRLASERCKHKSINQSFQRDCNRLIDILAKDFNRFHSEIIQTKIELYDRFNKTANSELFQWLEQEFIEDLNSIVEGNQALDRYTQEVHTMWKKLVKGDY